MYNENLVAGRKKAVSKTKRERHSLPIAIGISGNLDVVFGVGQGDSTPVCRQRQAFAGMTGVFLRQPFWLSG